MSNFPPLRRFPEAHKLPRATKARLIDAVRGSLATPAGVERAVTLLFNRQTAAERATETTREDNLLGVQHCHARRIAYYGKWLASGRHLDGYHLERARTMVSRYAATQLFEAAAWKAGLVSA